MKRRTTARRTPERSRHDNLSCSRDLYQHQWRGTHAGQLAVFVRFCGCNLNCSFCDTTWANEPDVPYVCQTTEEICASVDAAGINNITLTGGEPLLRDGMTELLTALSQKENRYIEIETNGSVDLTPFVGISPSIAFTMDYKLPGSGMEAHMRTENFALLRAQDTVKFVAGSQEICSAHWRLFEPMI